jgi:hypothetical protein
MANGNLLYKPVVPSLGNIAGDVKTAMQQALQYKQQKERYEQQRKDMMFKNFLANAKVTPFASVRKGNQKMLGDVMKKYEDQVQSLVSEIDGDADDREIIMKGRQLAVDTQQEINKIKSWEEQNAADRVAVRKELEQYPFDVKEKVFGYEGGEPNYSMQKMIPDWRKEMKELKNEMYKGDEATFTVVDESTGKKITSEDELVRHFWKSTEDGGWKPDVENQKQFFRNRLVSNDMLRASLLNEFNVKGKKIKDNEEIKYKMPNGEVYGIDEVADYAYDVMGKQVFMMKPERKIEPIDKSKEENGGGEITGIDFSQGYQKVTDHPFGDVNLPHINIADENITYDGNIIKGAMYRKENSNTWSDAEERSYKQAQLVGTLLKGGELYGRFQVRKSGGDLAKNAEGEQIYNNLFGNEGTIKEINELYPDTEIKSKKDLIKLGFREKRTGDELGYVVAPLDKNPGVTKKVNVRGIDTAYNIENYDKKTQKKIRKFYKDNKNKLENISEAVKIYENRYGR